MATTTPLSIEPEVEYPDSDGKPMSDHDLQYKWIVIFKEGLVVQYDLDPDVYVGADLLWYPVRGKPKIRGAPDVLVAFGRPKGLRGSYKQWVEGGIAPQVAFEVLSPGNRPGQVKRKFLFYQRHGVEEYYVYDPFNGSLEGWLRRGRRLVKVPRMQGFISPRLGIRFEPGPGPDNLTVIGRDGEPFLAPVQVSRQLAEERQRAEEAERLRAEERQRAEEADERAARYAAKLRELGIEPD
jgi:Uma2 family endonuclease